MSDPTRGITCPDLRRIVREAIAAGWEWGGRTGTTHARIRWPVTGDVLTFGTTPSVASWKTLATDIHRVSGVVVWRKGNHKRSRKRPDTSGFSLDAARQENAHWHQAWGSTVNELLATRQRLIDRCHELADDRATLRGIPGVLDEIAAIETKLAELHHLVPPFDPFTLRH